MRNFLILFGVLICMSFTPQTESKPEKATIYIYRGGQYVGAGANWSIFVDENKLCKLSNNKFMKVEVEPGKHLVTAKMGGMSIMKKETEVEIEAEAGKSYYVACNVKMSITRARLEMLEVTTSTAKKQMEKMNLDNCQEAIDGTN